MYEPPAIDKSSLLVYKYDEEEEEEEEEEEAGMCYPLDPAFETDAQDIREQQRLQHHAWHYTGERLT
jgi:hypothetical protein